jgi:mannose-6-phosphate isomerase-like protein (cupin superfamily)
MGIRRVVTGHSADGKSTVVGDDHVEPIVLDLLPGYAFHRLWGADEAPTFPDDGGARPAHAYFPPVGGFRFGLFTVPPETTVMSDDIDVSTAMRELDASLPGMASHMEPENPGMHTTDTIDFEYVVSGAIDLELDDGETVHLVAGDTVVQNGTRHAWRNRGGEPCEMVVVLIGAHRHG